MRCLLIAEIDTTLSLQETNNFCHHWWCCNLLPHHQSCHCHNQDYHFQLSFDHSKYYEALNWGSKTSLFLQLHEKSANFGRREPKLTLCPFQSDKGRLSLEGLPRGPCLSIVCKTMVVVMVIKEAKEMAITSTIVHANRVFLVSFSLNTCYYAFAVIFLT